MRPECRGPVRLDSTVPTRIPYGGCMGLRSRFSCVIWDVDGTIVDASDGILARLTIALDDFGLPAPRREELVHWIGPPMFDTFQVHAGMSPEQARLAVTHYREIGKAHGYTTGAKLFPGVGELIRELADAGVPQGVASSKPEVQVRALLDHFELTDCFASITGATLDEQTLSRKPDILAEELRRLGAAGVSTTRPVLIGDRHHDVEGGAVHGVPVVFVRWGFSWPHESEGAIAVADDVAQLRGILLAEDAQ